MLNRTFFPFISNSFLDEFLSDECEKKSFLYSKTNYPMNVFKIFDDNGWVIAYRLEYAMAGFSKEEIKISVVGDILKIEASHNKKEENSKEISIYNGISYKNLSLSYKLFNDADVNKIKSKYENGLLSVTVYKKEDNQKSIDINVE
jgi:HSP20 family protein